MWEWGDGRCPHLLEGLVHVQECARTMAPVRGRRQTRRRGSTSGCQPPGRGERRAGRLCPPRSGLKEEGEQGEGPRPPSLHWALKAGICGRAAVRLRAAVMAAASEGSDCLKGVGSHPTHTHGPPPHAPQGSYRRGCLGKTLGPARLQEPALPLLGTQQPAPPASPSARLTLCPASPRRCPPLVGGTRGGTGQSAVSGCDEGLGPVGRSREGAPPDAVNGASLELPRPR